MHSGLRPARAVLPCTVSGAIADLEPELHKQTPQRNTVALDYHIFWTSKSSIGLWDLTNSAKVSKIHRNCRAQNNSPTLPKSKPTRYRLGTLLRGDNIHIVNLNKVVQHDGSRKFTDLGSNKRCLTVPSSVGRSGGEYCVQ